MDTGADVAVCAALLLRVAVTETEKLPAFGKLIFFELLLPPGIFAETAIHE